MSLQDQSAGRNLSELDHNIIHVCFHIPTDLSEQTLLNHPHECGSGILEAEWHGDITEAPEWSDESCFDLIGSIQTDMMVTGIGV